MNTYVIHPDRSPERRAAICSHFGNTGLHLTRISAEDDRKSPESLPRILESALRQSDPFNRLQLCERRLHAGPPPT